MLEKEIMEHSVDDRRSKAPLEENENHCQFWAA